MAANLHQQIECLKTDAQFISLVKWFRDSYTDDELQIIHDEAIHRETNGGDMSEVWLELKSVIPIRS